jgi:hypothetical protein
MLGWGVINLPVNICTKHSAGNTPGSDSDPFYFTCVAHSKPDCELKYISLTFAFGLLQARFLRSLLTVADECLITAGCALAFGTAFIPIRVESKAVRAAGTLRNRKFRSGITLLREQSNVLNQVIRILPFPPFAGCINCHTSNSWRRTSALTHGATMTTEMQQEHDGAVA